MCNFKTLSLLQTSSYSGQTFENGHSYSSLIVSDMKPSDLDRIQFKWSHGFNIIHHRMYIESLKVIPLSSTSATLKTPHHLSFETDEFGIRDGQEVIFRRE